MNLSQCLAQGAEVEVIGILPSVTNSTPPFYGDQRHRTHNASIQATHHATFITAMFVHCIGYLLSIFVFIKLIWILWFYMHAPPILHSTCFLRFEDLILVALKEIVLFGADRL